MNNAVVVALCAAAHRLGMVTMRFNFRGVGGSDGRFSGGKAEGRDLGAALSLLRRWPGMDRRRIAVAGYSFGAAVILGAPPPARHARALILVAPPASALRSTRLRRDRRPRLFIAGERDRVSPPLDIQRALDTMVPPVRFAQIAGTGHSFRGHETEVAERAAEFLEEALALAARPSAQND